MQSKVRQDIEYLMLRMSSNKYIDRFAIIEEYVGMECFNVIKTKFLPENNIALFYMLSKEDINQVIEILKVMEY